MPLKSTTYKMRDITRLEGAVRRIESSIETKRDELEKANQDILRTERQIRQQQKKMGSYAALHATSKNAKSQRFGAAVVQQENQDALAHAFETLKSRAMLADKRFNEAKAYNQTLREQIDNMRREKRVYVRAFTEQEKELSALKARAAKNRNDIKQATHAKEKAKMQINLFKIEFAKKKSKLEDVMRDLEAKAQVDDESLEDEILASLGRKMSYEQESKLGRVKKKKKKTNRGKMFKRRIKKLTFSKIESDDDKRLMKNFGYYSDMWNNIRTQTGLESIDELVQIFLHLEQRKMARVKEANSLVNQIRSLKSEEKDMESERAAYVKENNQRMAKRKAFIRSLERDVQQCRDAIDDLKASNDEHRQIMESLASPIQRIYTQVAKPEIQRRLQKFLPQPLAKPVPGLGVLALVNNERIKNKQNDGANGKILAMMAFTEQRVTEMVQFYQAHMRSTANTRRGFFPGGPEGGGDEVSAFLNGPDEPTGKLLEHFKVAHPKIMSIASLNARKDMEMPDRPLSVRELRRLAVQDAQNLGKTMGGKLNNYN